MANANVSLQGQNNGAGAVDALFQEVFAGEVLTAFSKKTIMDGRVRTRSVTGRKSDVFANTGRVSGEFHIPGVEILGQDALHSETIISIDQLLIAPVFVADINEAMNHYEVRSEYSKQCGEALARTRDKTLMRVVAQTARSANKITGLPGGTTLTMAGFAAASEAAKGAALAQALFDAHKQLILNDIDPASAVAVVSVDNYFRLVQQKDLLNTDWGGAGSYADAMIPKAGGLQVKYSTMLPNQNDTLAGNIANGHSVDGGDVINTKYAADYGNVEALVFTQEAAGEVSLIDLSIQSEWDIRRQGTLLLARRATGMGSLRPECAIEIVRG